MDKKNILTTALVLGIMLASGIPARALSPEASMLYQEACSAEHQQDLPGAIDKLKKAISISGGDAMLYTKLAGIYAEIADYDSALAAYRKVIDLNPDDAFIYVSIGNIYETQGKYEDALSAYSRALDIFPEYKYNYFNIANVQYQLKKYSDAIKNYNIFLETYSAHSEARENLAASYLAVKDYENALANYKIIYNKNPGNFKQYYQYGIALLNTNNASGAVEMLEKAIELDAENYQAHLGLAQAYQDLGKNENSYAQYQIVLKNIPNLNTVRLDYANLLADMQKNTEALEQYNMYIKAYPNDSKGYANIATVYKELGNYDKAIENYLSAINKDSSNIDLKKDIANCYHNKKDYESALGYYDEILKVQPDDYNILFNKALSLHAMKRYEDAITIYKELLAKKSSKSVRDNLANALVSRGHERVDAQDYEEAINDFKSAIKDGYSDGYVYFGIARAYRGLGNNTKAAENYEKAISINPEKTAYSAEYSDFISATYSSTGIVDKVDSASGEIPSISLSMESKEPEVKKKIEKKVEKPVVVNKESPVVIKKNEDLISEGDKNYKDNNYDSALKNYQDALQLMPNDAVTLLKIGNIYKLREDNSKAINYYQKAIIVNPDYTDGWFNLGLAYANENNLIESQKCFEKVIDLDSNYNSGYAYYALAMAFEYQGKATDAIKNYKLFTKYNTDKNFINTAQEKIKQLQK